METTINSPAQTLPFRFHGRVGEYFRIWIVNIMLSIATLGTYSAWAKIRLACYRLDNLLLQIQQGLGNFIAGEQDRVKATGEKFAEVFDIDLAI